MKLDFGLQLQQEQKLIMTQELQLAVKVLQLTSYELMEYIDEQMVENPLLETEERNSDDLMQKLQNLINYSNDERKEYYQDDEEDVSPLTFVAQNDSLWDYLKEQLSLTPVSKKIQEAAEYTIDNINENGYLTVDIDNISSKCNVTKEEAEEAVSIVQSFEPAGICARNINECLLLQVKNKGLEDDIIENIINSMLEDVAKGKILGIARANNISVEKAEEYISIIKSLDPKPGIRYSNETTRYIIPDVFVEKLEGKYVVTVNDELAPRLRVNSLYKKILNDKNTNDYKYVKEKLQAAVWLIKSIEQRMNTIKKVVEAIITYQIDFFDSDKDLKPLILKQIAQDTGLHESTISRAIKGKYVQTPKGLFEIKNFFIRGIQNKAGEEIGTLKIKNRIKEIIDSEDTHRPFSDQQIADKMNNEGLNISRRTVAKYREEMNIPSSSKRKR